MDAVYICRGGENEELRYSIRSTLANLPVSNVVVVGEIPSWYIGPRVLVPQISQQKYRNAVNNLRTICNTPWISNDFLLMNDDFYTVTKIDDVPNYNGGSLRKKVETYTRMAPYSSYTKKLAATYRFLVRDGFPDPIDYELHVPMHMNKHGLSQCIYPNILWRSVYGNRYLAPGESINDVKVYNSPHLVDRSYDYRSGTLPFLSSEDSSFETLKNDILHHRFPSPSTLEQPLHGFIQPQYVGPIQ